MEEDDVAQINHIFKSFDTGDRGKISIECLPKILRLLNYNIGNIEIHDLMLEVDKKSLGYFDMK
jgi:Ca2+-binding EF-hand superfamily protein